MFNLVEYMSAKPFPLPNSGEAFVSRPFQFEDTKHDHCRKSDRYYKDFIMEVVDAAELVAKSNIRVTTGMERKKMERILAEMVQDGELKVRRVGKKTEFYERAR